MSFSEAQKYLEHGTDLSPEILEQVNFGIRLEEAAEDDQELQEYIDNLTYREEEGPKSLTSPVTDEDYSMLPEDLKYVKLGIKVGQKGWFTGFKDYILRKPLLE